MSENLPLHSPNTQAAIRFSPLLDSYSIYFLANLYVNRMIASCAIGNGALLLACLYLACPICGSCHNGILAREDWLPLPCPQNPGILGKGRVQFRDVPGYAAINTYLYFLYAAISCKGKTTDFNVLTE